VDSKLILEVIAIAFSVGAIVFAAGGFYYYVPTELGRLRVELSRVEKAAEERGNERRVALDHKIDKNFETQEKKVEEKFTTLDGKLKEKEEKIVSQLSGIGTKVSKNEKDAARRYHNITEAVLIAAPAKLEKTIANLLKEDAT
jgi:hypothetical protein